MSKPLTFNNTIANVCATLLDECILNKSEELAVKLAMKSGSEKGVISSTQAFKLGALWKEHINEGEYVHHDWWS